MLDPGSQQPEAELTVELADLETVTERPPLEVAPAAARRPSLWRHRDYMRIWSAATISLMGSQVSQFALPFIAAVILRATPFEVSLLAAVDMLPFILFTLPAGAWLDRIRRRPVLIFGDFGRAIALSTIPLAYALGVLTIWQLYLVGFVTGTLTVLFDVADQSYLPALLDADDLVEGNAKLQISGSAAQIAGPGVAGSLISVIAAPFAIFLDAASFVASGSLISLVRKPEAKPQRRVTDDGKHTSLRQDIADGLRYVFGNRYLRMIAGSTATSNLGSSMLFSIFPVFVFVQLGLEHEPALVGLAFSLGSFGLLVGAFTSAPLAKRFGVGPVIIASMFVNGPAMLILALMPSWHVVVAAIIAVSTFVGGFSAVVYNVNQVSFRQAITPLDMQGRMNATMRFLVWGIMPIGSVLGGVMGSFLPLRAVVLAGGVVCTLAFLWVMFSPVRSLAEIPTQARERAPEA